HGPEGAQQSGLVSTLLAGVRLLRLCCKPARDGRELTSHGAYLVAENEPIFNFMYLRPVETLAAANEQRDYIRDLNEHPARTAALSMLSMLPRDSSLIDDSPVAKIVCEAVFGSPVDISEGIAQLKLDLLTLLVEVIPVADINNPPQNPN